MPRAPTTGGHTCICAPQVFTHAPVTDIGSFAPRDYTSHGQPAPIVLHNHAREGDLRAEMHAIAQSHDGWYRRAENNGWRPVAGDALGDYETTARTSRPIVWHHDKMVRKEEALKRQKQKKRQWLREMYALGKSADDGERTRMGAVGGGGEHEDFGGEGDEDVDALLQCAAALPHRATPLRRASHTTRHRADASLAVCLAALVCAVSQVDGRPRL